MTDVIHNLQEFTCLLRWRAAGSVLWYTLVLKVYINTFDFKLQFHCLNHITMQLFKLKLYY